MSPLTEIPFCALGSPVRGRGGPRSAVRGFPSPNELQGWSQESRSDELRDSSGFEVLKDSEPGVVPSEVPEETKTPISPEP